MREVWKGSPLLAPAAPVLVSCGSMERPNLITVGWVGIVSTQPPRLSISIRPERYSYGLICESGEFAVNLPTRALTRAVDWCGVKSGREVDKFAALGLHALEGSAISAPLLAESPAAMECRVFERIPLGSHDLFLADILAVNLESSLLDEKGVFLPAETGFAGAGEAGSIWRMRTWKTEHTSKKRAHTITAVNRFR